MPSVSHQRFFHLHLVSDATGETLSTVAKAATAQYADFKPVEHIYALIRTAKQLHKVLQSIEEQPGVVLYTIISHDLRHQLQSQCDQLNIPCISILDPIIAVLARYLNAETKPLIGGQHILNAEYFRRMDALQFTITHDDGQNTDDLSKADVILLGISRTSKTPTSIYLAQRGIRVANIPVVSGIPLPASLLTIRGPLIVGLIASADRIAQIRRHRLLALNEPRTSSYIDPRHITNEMLLMKTLSAEHGWPLIDVTRRSVEETAASIQNLLSERHKAPFS